MKRTNFDFITGATITIYIPNSFKMMKLNTLKITLIALIFVQCTSVKTPAGPPLAPVNVVTDTYFGTTVEDPYRYMENLQDKEVAGWFRAQADYSDSILNSIPGRQKLIDKMIEFDGRKSEKIGRLVILDNDRYFYLKSRPDDETAKLYYRDGYNGSETLLYDPLTFSTDTSQLYVIDGFSPSDDGKRIALTVSTGGSENGIMMIMDVENQTLYPERIDRCWISFASWLPDGNSFLVNRTNSNDVHDMDRELNSKVYLHQVGTDPAKDAVVFSAQKYPELGIEPMDIPVLNYDNDTKYIYAYAYTVANSLNVFYAPVSEINNEHINWKQLFTPEDEVYDFKVTDKDIYFYTPNGSPNFKIAKTSLQNPDIANATVVVPEDPEAIITSFNLTSDGLYYVLTKNGVESELYFMKDAAGEPFKIDLPFAAGSIGIRNKKFTFNDLWVELSGWTSDRQRFRYLADENKLVPENLSSLAEFPEYDDLVVEELMVKSHDGVLVPLSLIYKNGLEKNGNNPVFFYGYGAYGASMDPFFSPAFLLWVAEGGILAVAHVRGGGELGESWHKAGYKTTKPNTWKDLIAQAEFLINEKYTSPKKIAINSASAGGILIGRAMTERPDLFAVAIPEVGCLNALRGEDSPNGPVNIPEFGTSKDSVECMALIEMDAYLHVVDGEIYPASLITAGMNDPRVIAWQPAKFAARIQAANASDKPILFLPDYDAGHGIGDTKSKRFESFANVLSFALWQTGNPDFQIN